MSEIFSKIISTSITSCYVILFVIFVRLLLKKTPKKFSYALWSVVFIRLICPFSISSIFSLIPQKAVDFPVDNYINHYTIQTVQRVSPVINNPPVLQNSVAQTTVLPQVTENINFKDFLISALPYIWILGIVLIAIYSLVSYIRLGKKLKNSQYLSDNIYTVQNLETAFVFGIVKPIIYLSHNLSENEMNHVIMHEQTHIKRHDHIIKIIAFIVAGVYWFNPLVWVAFILMTKDMEMSCDERVLISMNNDIKKEYSMSLLSLSSGKSTISGTPLAFGEGNTKHRIKNVLNYKKSALWVIIIAIIAVAVVCIGLLCDPKKTKENEVLDLSDISEMNIGAELPFIMYEDNNKAILTGTFGILEYSFENEEIINRISYDKLKKLDIEFLNANVSIDGKIIYIQNFNPEIGNSNDFYYTYNTQNQSLKKYSGKPKDIKMYSRPLISPSAGYNEDIDKFIDLNYLIGDLNVYGDNEGFIYTRAEQDWSMKSLEIVRYNYASKTNTVYTVFNNDLTNTKLYDNPKNISANILSMNFKDMTITIQEPGENKSVSDLCEINCKDAEILKDEKTITFEDLNPGYLINIEIGSIIQPTDNEIYPHTNATKIVLMEDASEMAARPGDTIYSMPVKFKSDTYLLKFVMESECYQYGIPDDKKMICGDFKFELYDKKSKLVNEVNYSTPCTTELGYQLDCFKAKELFPFNVIYTSQNDIKYPIIVVGKANGQIPCNVYGIDESGKLKEYIFDYGDYPFGNGIKNTMEFSSNFVVKDNFTASDEFTNNIGENIKLKYKIIPEECIMTITSYTKSNNPFDDTHLVEVITNDNAPIGCEVGRTLGRKNVTKDEMMKELSTLDGFKFKINNVSQLKLVFKNETPKIENSKIVNPSSSAWPTTDIINDDGTIFVPNQAGYFNYYIDLLWGDGTKEIIFFKVEITDSITVSSEDTLPIHNFTLKYTKADGTICLTIPYEISHGQDSAFGNQAYFEVQEQQDGGYKIISVCDFDTFDCYALNKDLFDDKIPIELDIKAGIVKINGTIYDIFSVE